MSYEQTTNTDSGVTALVAASRIIKALHIGDNDFTRAATFAEGHHQAWSAI